MLRRILIGLDGSQYSDAAVDLGIEWGRRLGCDLVGLTVVDWNPAALATPLRFGAGEYHDYTEEIHLDEARRRRLEFVDDFTGRCGRAGIGCETLEDVGSPCEQVLLEAERYDLVLLGQHTFFHTECREDPEPSLLRRFLRQAPRPLVITPAEPASGKSVLVAYDGSPQAAKALAAFQASGLDFGEDVQVLSVGTDEKEVTLRSYRGAEFLGSHDVNAKAMPVVSSSAPAEVILEHVDRLDSRLVVMGAYGLQGLREFLIGSATRAVIEGCSVPLFLHH